MKENEWVNADDMLPGLNQVADLRYSDGVHVQGCLKHFTINGLIKWRYTTPKRPDFSKLKKGDLIFVSTKCKAYEQVGFYCHPYDQTIRLTEFKDLDSMVYQHIEVKDITKITRINLEEKTFEEI